MSKINRSLLQEQIQEELKLFKEKHPRSLKMFERSKEYFLNGVPMNWMTRWAGEFPIFVKEAYGALIKDVEGRS